MFEHIHEHAALLHDEMKVIFWLLLAPLLSLLITIEIVKSDNEGPNVQEVLKRTIIAVIMLILFDFTIESIAMISDGIAAQISDQNDLLEVVKKYGSSVSNSDMGLFDFRKHILFFFALGAYLFAYIGYFSAVSLVHFVWAILYVFAPLMILCFIPRSTSSITSNLYRSLIKVSLWKVVWALLGAFLLKMAVVPDNIGFEGAMLAMVMNLIIGLSMLLVPILTKSLLADGLQSISSGMAAAPALMALKVAAAKGKSLGLKGIQKGKQSVGFVGKPLVAPLKDSARARTQKLKRRFKNLNNSMSDYLEDEATGRLSQDQNESRGFYRKKEQRKKYAIRDSQKRRNKHQQRRRYGKRKNKRK